MGRQTHKVSSYSIARLVPSIRQYATSQLHSTWARAGYGGVSFHLDENPSLREVGGKAEKGCWMVASVRVVSNDSTLIQNPFVSLTPRAYWLMIEVVNYFHPTACN